MIDETSTANPDNATLVDVLGAGVRAIFDALDLSLFVIAPNGVLVWGNAAATALVGDRVGSSYLELIPRRDWEAARRRFARKIRGAGPTTERLELVGAHGRGIEVLAHSAPLREGDAVLAVVGVALPLSGVSVYPRTQRNGTAERLTPRQGQVLGLLARGLETEQIAAELGVATETTRNHIRAVLGRLEAHTRLEAVIVALRNGLIEVHSDRG